MSYKIDIFYMQAVELDAFKAGGLSPRSMPLGEARGHLGVCVCVRARARVCVRVCVSFSEIDAPWRGVWTPRCVCMCACACVCVCVCRSPRSIPLGEARAHLGVCVYV